MTEENFETSLKDLEELVEQLESGELTLEESLRCFETGIQRVTRCQQQLRTAEARVEVLLKDGDGELRVEPFDQDEAP
jgi:exodeoxyribonuclease VII small subunit